MSNENKRKTWAQPWSYREGTIVTGAILLIGFVLQAASGGTVLRLAKFPWNLLAGLAFVVVLGLFYFLLKKRPIVKGLGSVKAALPAILGFTFLVLLMGFVKQDVESKSALVRLLGLTHLVKTWPFMLINLYLMILLGVVTLKRLKPFNLKNAGFFLNHFGLFLVLFSTALGSSDMQRLTMNCYKNQPVAQAIDGASRVVESPFSVTLLHFDIEEFRPKVALVDAKSGQALGKNGKDQLEMLDRDLFKIGQYTIQVEQFLPSSWKNNDSYSASNEDGSAPSAKVKVTKDGAEISGWICCGSYANPPEQLKLDDNYSLVMLPAEPRKFSSGLKITTKNGSTVETTIEVNKPFHFDGWSVYQLSYNTEMGRWSNLSVLELVRDPWLPVVYTGIFLMMAGAIFLFIFGQPKNGGKEHVA